MTKSILLIIFVFCGFLSLSGQITRLNEEIVNVPVIEGKVAFLREIPSPKNTSRAVAFQMLRDWAVENYGKDPFISSVRIDSKNNEVLAISRIELVLPADSHGIQEKFVMRYRLNGYVFDDRCVLEVTDMTFMYQKMKGQTVKNLPKSVKAENMITDSAINQKDDLIEIRKNTRKSTLQFINQLAKNFEVAFGYAPTFWK